MAELKPFHESIRLALKKVSTIEGFIALIELIDKTEISSGHKEIIKSVKNNFMRFPQNLACMICVNKVLKGLKYQQEIANEVHDG